VVVHRKSNAPQGAFSRHVPRPAVEAEGQVVAIVSQASAHAIVTSYSMDRPARSPNAVIRDRLIGLYQWTSGAGPPASMDTFWLVSRQIWWGQPTLFTT